MATNTKKIQDVQITRSIDGSDKLLVVKSGINKTRSVTVDDFIHENSINTGEICNCAITEPKIGNSAIDTRHLKANIVTSDNICSDGISANCITTGTLDASNVNVTNLNANCITSGTICGDLISGLTVSADCITGLSITADDITSGTIDASQVTVCNIDANCITSGSLDANRIGAIDISTCNLNANNISTGTLDANRIQSNSIQSCHINTCSIQTCHLAANSIDAGKIAAGAVGATALAAGSVAATALESNIIIAGSIQSSNFDGFNYTNGTTGDQLLQFLDAGENGFFLDERTGTAVFTDIVARDNIIAANYIKYNENSGLSAIDGSGNFGVNVDSDFMSIQDGKVTITRIPSDTVVDQSLFTTPNTIFFGQSETQVFELPTFNQERNFFGTDLQDTSTWSLCAMTVHIPNLFSNDNYKFDKKLNNQLYLYNENDYRNVSIYRSEFVSDNLLPESSSKDDLNDTGFGTWYRENGSGVQCEHVILMIDLHALGITAAQVSGNIILNNLKIKWDTSKLNVLSLIKRFSIFPIKTYMSSSSAIHSDISTTASYVGGQQNTGLTSSVTNPTVIGDIFEATVDINLGHPKTAAETGGNAQRFITLVVKAEENIGIELDDNTFPDYRGYVPLSAEFTTDTNLRFEATGAIPETKNFDLSSINHLIPGKQLVRAVDHTLTQTRAHIPFEWIGDRPRQLGFPELNINSPLSGTTALNGGSPVRDILEEHGSWTGWSTFNEN